MNKKIVIITSVIIILTITTFIITYNLNTSFYSPELTCEILSQNQNPDDAIDIVFITTENVTSLQKYIDTFLSTKPFSENSEKFNFYQVSIEPECEIIQGKAVYCYSKQTIKQSASCPNDFVVTISDAEPQMRSSAYKNLISLNSNHKPSVLLHEFGHVFANLADEYTVAKIPFGAKNCNKNEIYEENFEGCSKENYFRSSKASLMKTLAVSSYDSLNENLIKKKMDKY